MRRRDLIFGFAGAAALPRMARAQQPAMPVIGYVGPQPRELSTDRLDAFHQGLKETGFVNHRNVTIEYRWADNQCDRIPGFLADLIDRRVSVIAMAGSTPGAIAAKGMTSTIPVVFSIAGNPVRLGLVESLNRPNGNVTGVTLWNSELVPKRVELLRELVPATTTIGLLIYPNTPTSDDDIRHGRAAASALGLHVRVLNASTESEIPAAIETFAARDRGALLVGSDVFFFVHRKMVAEVAAKHALPAIYDRREFALAGGLISYGSSILDLHRHQGVYVARVLNGEKPAELPVLLPTTFNLVLNLTTARKLGLEVPLTFVARVDEVIE